MIYIAAGVVVFFGIFVYVLFMIFLPEWVGITGKTALKNEQAHLGSSASQTQDDSQASTGAVNPAAQDAIKKTEQS